MGPFIASEALAAGRVSRYELAADHRRLLPDVDAPKRARLCLDDRIEAAWLWSRRTGIVTGLAASALHGAGWVDPQTAIELNLAHNKTPAGIIVRRETLLDREIGRIRGMTVTTVERTAFDLARRGPFGTALQRLDPVARAAPFETVDVVVVLDAHPRLRGRRRVPRLLDLVDPRPRTQIPVIAADGYRRYFPDMGWEEFMVAVEYDGEQHRSDRVQYRGDSGRSEYLDGLGWRRIRVLAGDRRDDIVRRVAGAGVPLG